MDDGRQNDGNRGFEGPDEQQRGKELVRIQETQVLPELSRDFAVPALVARANASNYCASFLIGEFPNPHTRRAYKRQIDKFLAWCDKQGLELNAITPLVVGVYRDRLNGSTSNKKQMLTALRRFFDVLVQRHYCLLNPASSTKNPREAEGDEGKTREFPRKEVEKLLGALDPSTLVGKRDRAVLASWAATGARIGAIAKLRRKNIQFHDGQWVLELDEKNAKRRVIPVRHDLERFLLDYLETAGLMDAPGDEHVFRSIAGKTGEFRGYQPDVTDSDGLVIQDASGYLKPDNMRRMLKRRLTDAGFGVKATRTYSGGSKRTVHSAGYSPHSFRVMVVTDLLGQGVDVADVAHLVGHSSTRTTEPYNRNQRIALR